MAAHAFLTGATSSFLLSLLLLLPSLHNVSAGVSAADDTSCLSQHALDTGKQLAERFDPGGVLSRNDFGRLLAALAGALQLHSLDDLGQYCVKNKGQAGGEVKLDSGEDVNCTQLLVRCPTIDVIFTRHSLDNVSLTSDHLSAALQEAVFSITNQDCYIGELKDHDRHKPTIGQAWGYGLGFVTLVCIISNIGGLLTPCMTKNFFQKMLQFLVAMGAGTLCATGLLVLIPEAFDIVSSEELAADYVWKSATALFSIYVFFISERLLKFLLKSKELKREHELNMTMIVKPPSSTDNNHDVIKANDVIRETAILYDEDDATEDHGHSHFATPAPGKRTGPVATVAWMVMIGDIIHNFVDGMAIGAAFTENVYLGVSIGIAVLCEELPHELSDVAILLHSGLTMKRALFINFLSACVCYIGLIVGVVLGENTEANRWILAMAGGLFLYVPLVDMLPDMSQHLDQKLRESHGARKQAGKKGLGGEVWGLLLMQAMGLIVGMCIILVVVYFSGDISVAGG